MRCVPFIIMLAVSSLVQAVTIHVPADYPKIQDAIDAAVQGDLVLVAPGTYEENIDFKGKAITVTSSGGAAVTVIDGGNPSHPDFRSVVLFKTSEGPDSILKGFSLQNGQGTYFESSYGPKQFCGGGIFCCQTSPTITDNILEMNSTQEGGGIFCCEASPVITCNTIAGNKAASWGGGISCNDGADPLISGNIISGNHGDDSGGGIFCLFSSPTITENEISNNTTGPQGGGGGGIFCYNSSPLISFNSLTGNSAQGGGAIECQDHGAPTILYNEITGNQSTWNGGAINCLWDAAPEIIGNRICGNIAIGGGGICVEYFGAPTITSNIISGNVATGWNGGGIYAWGTTDMIVTNNLVFDNRAEAGIGGGIYCTSNAFIANNTVFMNRAHTGGGILYEGSSTALVNMIVWDNRALVDPQISGKPAVSHSDVMGGWPGVGNIDADPCFAAPIDRDLHLLFTSPCRDAGAGSMVIDPMDFEGDPRDAYGLVDMGADEFYTHLYVTGDQAPGGQVQGKLVGHPGTAPVGLFFGSGVAFPSWPTTWGFFHLQPPWLLLLLPPIPADGILEIPAVVPHSPSAPYDAYLQALIGLSEVSLTNLCVLEIR